jgi:endonuclease/exonuclease/phosphatase (EEP) superfamily protein YafD
LYIILEVCSGNITVLNVHAPTDNKTDSFYEELEHVSDQFLKYHMNILLGNFNAKTGEADFKTDN